MVELKAHAKAWRGLWISIRAFAAAVMALAALGFAAGSVAYAQPAAKSVRVVVRELPPFVQKKGDEYTGFSVELWKAIAARLEWKTAFVLAPDVRGQLDAVERQTADVGVGAISITADRSMKYDFSQPILNAGLQIVVRADRAPPESSALGSLLSLLLSPAVFVWLGIAVLLTVVPAHIVWFFERNHPSGIVTSKSYFPGIFQAFYWGLGALATQADSMPRQWVARIVAILWMFSGVVFVAFYTAQLTATLTVQQFKSEISGPDDLPGKKVATVQASTSAAYLTANGVQAATFRNVQEALQALTTKQVDAVVYDAPVLQYFAAHEGAGKVRAVGTVFHSEDYGFAFRYGGDMRRSVDGALLALRESGEYDRIAETWFGKK